MSAAPDKVVESSSEIPAAGEPVGIRGWLLWFGIGQVLGVVIGLASWTTLGEGLGGDLWALAGQIPWHRPMILFETAAQVTLPIAGVVGLFLISRRDPKTPIFYIRVLGLLAAYGVIEYVGIQVVFPALEAVAVNQEAAVEELRQMRAEATSGALRAIAVGLVWGLYWRRSRRVHNTFLAPLAPGSAPTHHGT